MILHLRVKESKGNTAIEIHNVSEKIAKGEINPNASIAGILGLTKN
jgi:hypothetical protein